MSWFSILKDRNTNMTKFVMYIQSLIEDYDGYGSPYNEREHAQKIFHKFNEQLNEKGYKLYYIQRTGDRFYDKPYEERLKEHPWIENNLIDYISKYIKQKGKFYDY